MGFSMELVKAKRRIKELEADVDDLLEQLANSRGYSKDIPSMADIVLQTGILADDYAKKFIIDIHQLNIPFTKPPILLPIMEIPNSKSMDGFFDYGNNNLYIKPVDELNHRIMVDWIAKEWFASQGLKTVDAVYRIMVNDEDDSSDFTKPQLWYAIHRLVEVGFDENGRYFWFAGINNPARDTYPARDYNIIWLNTGTIA